MKELLFILTPSDGVPVTLDNSPDGWDESMIVTERSRKYHGIFRSFTIPLKFIKDGATIIREEFYTYGMAASCSIQVQKLNKVTLAYFTAYTGKIDFAMFKDHDTSVEVMSIDTSFAQLIKANEATEYEVTAIDLFNPFLYEKILISNNNFGLNEIWAIRPKNLLSALIDKMTNGGIVSGDYAVKSLFLDSVSDELLLTTGQTWRTQGLTGPGNTIFKTTLQDFFKSLDALFCLGMGIEVISGKETIVIEEREYFYNTTTIHNVGESKNLTIGMVSDFNFNKIKGGYPEKDYNDDSITEAEFNTETNYQIQNSVTPNEYDIQSKYRADFQEIQKIIDEWPTSPADENDVDYDIYFHSVQTTTPHIYSLKTSGLLKHTVDGTTSNILAQNVPISPRRNLDAHKVFISSCAFGFENGNIVFTSGGGRQAINKTSIGNDPSGVFLNEYDGFVISYGNIYFKPLEINIDAAYPSDLVNKIAANPYGCIEFTYGRNTYKGYILKMETKLSGAGSVKYSLLSTAENDLTKLIR